MLENSLSLEMDTFTLYGIHILISFLLAVVLSSITRKRYVTQGDSVTQKDKLRAQHIAHKGFIYKTLFKVSLHKNNTITNILFLFFFNLAMPVVGYLFSIWITFYLKNVSYQKKVTNTNILNLDEFGTSFLKVERIFGEGSMVELLHSDYGAKSKKLKALSSLSENMTPANLRIIKSTLSSKDDEIRMFGYATINKAEKAINTKINTYLEIYKQETDKKPTEQDEETIANAAKELATLYWELIYSELSHESLKAGFLTEVKKYIKIAKAYYEPQFYKIEGTIKNLDKKQSLLHDVEEKRKVQKKIKKHNDTLVKLQDLVIKMSVLMGKVYMSEQRYEDASTEFTWIQELYAEQSSFIVPYLAEIQFLLGNYTTVSAMLNNSLNLSLNATLHPVIEQWKKS